jgi:hypothetical protein
LNSFIFLILVFFFIYNIKVSPLEQMKLHRHVIVVLLAITQRVMVRSTLVWNVLLAHTVTGELLRVLPVLLEPIRPWEAHQPA